MITPSKRCAICGKAYKKAFARSHSMQYTIRRLQPNLQWLRLVSGRRVRACTSCIKSISKGKIRLPEFAL
ncbi:MAG: L28 family ribosomal protein [bacterium]|nr:L28 family ribosomal protein [bacterium]